jgi:hypothetical protein
MNHVFAANLFSDRDPDQNLVQMNSLFMNLITQSTLVDCQSQPLKQYFGDLYLKARFSIENTFDKLVSASPIELTPPGAFLRFVNEVPYSDTRQFRAEVPEGLKVTYLEYLEALIPAQIRANTVVDTVIKPFEKFIGKMISDPIFRNQARHQIKEFTDLEPQYEKTVKSMAACFGKNDYHASAAFGEVVKRNNDWRLVFDQTSELRGFYQAFPQKEITKRLNGLYEMLDELVEQIKLDHYDQVEKEVTQILSTGLYHIAKEVELAALTTFRSKTFITAINTTIVNGEEVFYKAK